jgi:hypothetical protein
LPQIMANSPPLSRVLFGFFLLLALSVGIAALVWPAVRAVSYAPLRDALLPDFYLNPDAAVPVRISVVLPPALETWVRTSAEEFSRENPLIQVEITALRGIDAGRRLNSMTGLPDAWIAEAEYTRTAAGGIPYQAEGTGLAGDSFVWLATTARTDLAGGLDWRGVARAAENDPLFRVALPPLNSIEGMAACYSAAAEYHDQAAPGAAQINDAGFQSWLARLRQAAPDLSRNPFDQLNSRPPQADAGFLLRTDWARLAQGAFQSQAPRYGVSFNYPFYMRSGWEELPSAEAAARRQAVEKLRNYLGSGAAQDRLAGYGLSRAGADPGGRTPDLDESAIRALQFCWR